MSDTLVKQIVLLEAQADLLVAQIKVLRSTIAPLPAATVSTSTRHERCAGIAEDRCALQDEDARMPRGSFADAGAWECAGCHVLSGAVTTQ